ncbi:hypothetical protein CMO86_00325 [Candidatus Woesearchaeota archaeon]|jgi:hypothetical protein|nr:hypothetical protein [Candidatus Woesearchaeota archaeon]|tara:strand:+ start:319 stop:501 length:183 start_codon:yes stop_codon:yes gene_type:complete
MLTTKSLLEYASRNRELFFEIVDIFKNDEPLFDIINQQNKKINLLSNQLSNLKRQLNTNI